MARIVRRRVILGRVAAVLALAVAGGLPPALRRRTMLQQVGLPGWQAESGRRCEDPRGTPWRHCYGEHPRAPGAVHSIEHISLDRRTGRLTLVQRVWQLPDSLTWRRAQDSVVQALRARGGEPIGCPIPADSAGELRAVSAWRFREQDVRVLASRLAAPGAESPWWTVQVDGSPVGFSGCDPWVHRSQWLTVDEVVARVTRWLAGKD